MTTSPDVTAAERDRQLRRVTAAVGSALYAGLDVETIMDAIDAEITETCAALEHRAANTRTTIAA